ncbi:hypothetical protein CKM354_000090600 [Cercospora kikuchii]|uniref:Uncharacterized protein n=1 Tax=Cercospora kikuchii TaxID=84275 RepID=A0A9P3C9S9_9PEZI|nr:uncharacterized protein CKM354_000090600 [Cercospora kikuchii]GIZ37461.1 hypothetical protein CKM354_000090600 [Cercospora kikuchii]
MTPDGDGTAVTDNVSNSTPAKDHRLVIDGLSLQKLDKLQSVVVDRLGGGGFGDWWVHGHKSSNDNRHLALEEVFALKRAIEDLNSTLTQQGRAPELLDKEIKANSKAAVTMNTKTKETMRSLVAQEMEDKMRDINIKMERMESKQAILDKENNDLRETIKSLGVKVKKNCDAEIRGVCKTIEDVKRQAGEAQAAIKEDAEHGLNGLRAVLKETQQGLVFANRKLSWTHDLARLGLNFCFRNFDAIRKQVKYTNPEIPEFPKVSDPKYKEKYPDV